MPQIVSNFLGHIQYEVTFCLILLSSIRTICHKEAYYINRVNKGIKCCERDNNMAFKLTVISR